MHSPFPPPMPPPSEDPLSGMPLRKRGSPNANTTELSHSGPNPSLIPTEVTGLYRELGGPEPKPPMTPPSPKSHGALLSRESSTVASLDSAFSRTSRTSSRRFERPNRLHIILHVVVCCVAYPIICAGVVSARDKSLFWARLIVGLWCAGVGVMIGWSLVMFARKYAEAAAWATVIHLSYSENGLGIKMKDLADNTHHPESLASGFRLLWTRFRNGATNRRAMKTVDSRPWSIFIIFYVFLIFVAGTLPFVLGRVVNISTYVIHQIDHYYEVTIWGSLSESDIAAAESQLNVFNDYVWTLAPNRTSLPTAIRFDHQNTGVYFAELTQAQLRADGTGLVTFNQNGSIPNRNDLPAVTLGGASDGSMLKIPRWGIRMSCDKLPDPEKYIVPRSNGLFSYVIVPRAFLDGLYSRTPFFLTLPDEFKTPNISFLSTNDSLPSNINREDVAYIAGFSDNGAAHSFHSLPPITGEGGNGWIGTEIALVRLNTSYTPNGKFPVYSNTTIVDASGFNSRIGYDAVVCVELYEPYVMETYNSSLSVPRTESIAGLDGSTDFESSARNKGPHYGGYTRALNSTGKDAAYYISHDNSINQMLKDNVLDRRYVPSPMTVSFTGGVGPESYTELSPQFYADVRGLADASNMLPFLSGTGPIIARAYPYAHLASASFRPPILAGVLGVTLLLGVLAGFLVPALPFDIPRRGFGLFSWVAALRGQELGGELTQNEIDRYMDLGELEKKLGEKRVHFVI